MDPDHVQDDTDTGVVDTQISAESDGGAGYEEFASPATTAHSFTDGLGEVGKGFLDMGSSLADAGDQALYGIGAVEHAAWYSLEAAGDAFMGDREGALQHMETADQATNDADEAFHQVGTDLGF
jgi:hypothetical protein